MRFFTEKCLDNLLEQLTENNVNPVFIAASEGKADPIVYKASDKTEALLSKLKTDIIGNTFLGLFPAEIGKPLKKLFRSAKRAKSTQNHLAELTDAEQNVTIVDFIVSYMVVGTSDFYFIQCTNRTKEILDIREIEKLNKTLLDLSEKEKSHATDI